MILLVVWAMIELLGPESYHLPGMAIIATVKATLLLALSIPCFKILISKRDIFADSTSLKLGEDLEMNTSLPGKCINVCVFLFFLFYTRC